MTLRSESSCDQFTKILASQSALNYMQVWQESNRGIMGQEYPILSAGEVITPHVLFQTESVSKQLYTHSDLHVTGAHIQKKMTC